MTDIKLLPLPAEIRARDFKWTAVEVYARANVEHHTAAQAAEIAALRAEVQAQPPAEAQAQGGGEVVAWWNPDAEFSDPFSQSQTRKHRIALYAAPPSAPVVVKGLKARAWELLQAEYDRDYFAGNYEDAAIDAIVAALAQQPSAAPVGLAEAQRLLALSQWKPIESAPKDGTTVLIHYTNCLGNGRTIKAKYLPRFYEESGCADGDGVDEYDEANDRYTYLEGWWEVIDNWGEFGFVKVHEGEPTHWMMMPIPPREAASA